MRWDLGHGLELDEAVLEISYCQSPGPGGQNVNRVASTAVLRYDLEAAAFPEPVRERARRLGKRWLTADGALVIHSSVHRSQRRNRDEAIARLVDLLRDAVRVPRRRRASGVPPGSRMRRLTVKRQRGETKARRRPPRRADGD